MLAGALLAFIVVAFMVGWFVLKNHSPKVKSTTIPRTGMMILTTPPEK